MKSAVFLLDALKCIAGITANVIRSVLHAGELLNPDVVLIAGLVIVGFQIGLLPWQSNSGAPLMCLVAASLVGFFYALPHIKYSGEYGNGPKPKGLLFWLFLITWPLPLVCLIYQSRAGFFRSAVSYKAVEKKMAAPSDNRPLFVLVSDLHVTDQPRTLEHQPGRGKAAARLLPAIGRLHPRLCIIAGDLTDRGSPAEWHLLDTFLRHAFSVQANFPIRVLLVPGNHDIQGSPGEVLNDLNLRGYGDLAPQVSFVERTVDFYRVAAEWEGDLSPLSGGKLRNEPFIANWKSLSRDAGRFTIMEIRDDGQPTDLSRNANEETPITSPQPRPMRILTYTPQFYDELAKSSTLFNAMFPLKYEDPGIGLEVLLLNSSSVMREGISMGLGNLGGKQLQALHTELAWLQGMRLKYLVVVLHHAPVRRESDQWTLKQAFTRHPGNTDVYAHTYLALDFDDAKDLMDSLGRFARARPDVQVVVLHGHRHGAFLGRTDQGVLVVEAPAVVESALGVWVGAETSHGLQVSWLPTSTLHLK